MLQQISIWEAETFYTPQDFIIVGAGFTGLWTAFFLKQKYPSKSVSVVERGAVPDGASLRNAGFACFGSYTEILSDIKTMGYEKTFQLVKGRFDGLKTIRQYFNESLFDYNNFGGYELITNDDALNRLDEINNFVSSITEAKETYVLKDNYIERFGFQKVKHIIENSFEGGFHPGKLVMELIKKLVSMNVQFRFGTEIKEVEENENAVLLHTMDKSILKAGHVFLCTNAFTKSLLPNVDIVPARGQILLTEPIPNLQVKGAFHFDEGYYYFRNLNNRILLGGARNTSFETEYTLEPFTSLPVQQALENFLSTVILPGRKPQIEHRWAGIMAMGSEKYPIVKQINKRTLCAVRLSGMGVALAPTLAKQLVEMV